VTGLSAPIHRRANEQHSPLAFAGTMSVVGNNRVGIPIVALHDAEGAVVEVETKNGELVRRKLHRPKSNMIQYPSGN
jgi:hypothetical protein